MVDGVLVPNKERPAEADLARRERMTMTSITSQFTEGQKKQYGRFVQDAGDRAFAETGFDKDSLQRLIENGDGFQADIIASIARLSVTNQYANEETESNYGYLSGYRNPVSIPDQIARLRELFTGIELGTADLLLAEQPKNPNADGPFAIPDWHLIASTYPEAVLKVFDLIKKTRGKFYNYGDGQIDSAHLRENKRSEKAWATIRETQSGNTILIVQAQFGLRHRGRSVRRALEVMSSSEFGLGAYATGIMLLTNPIRLQHYGDLWIDCAGDEWSWSADGVFGYAPFFSFRDGEVRFDTYEVECVSRFYGSVSAFLSQ
ncbi:MAG: hypothetical protein AAB881_01120 [Patescibacteria group bacterium]